MPHPSTASPRPVDLVVDCPTCRLERGVVETYDALAPGCRFGVAAHTRCKLCEAAYEGVVDRPITRVLTDLPANRCPACAEELGPEAIDRAACARCGVRAALVATRPARSLATRDDIGAALDAWAAREGHEGRAALIRAALVLPDEAAVTEAILRGDVIEVLADPFETMGLRVVSGGAPRVAPTAPVEDEDIPPPPPSAPPRAIVYPLVSVISADGEIHPAEQDLVDRFLASEGLAPLATHEIRVHHPSEVAHLVPPARREAIVQLMCETAAIDGMPDESERRVIRAYATAFDVAEDKIDFWLWGYEAMHTPLARQLWLKLRRFVLSARWA